MNMDHSIDLACAKKFIDSLDLTPVIKRLVHINNWTYSEALLACQQYKNYLYLKKKYYNQYELPPSNDIDEVWHAHILHTNDYTVFCEKLFGIFLHHHPYHSTDGKISKQKLQELFEKETQELYYKEFGEYIYAIRCIPLMKRVTQFLNKFKKNKTDARENTV